MNFPWTLFIDLGILSAALLVGTLIRAKVPFFQKYLVPNALTAGFLALPLYNFVLPLIGHTADGLGDLVYHLLSLSFIAMTLRRAEPSGVRGDRRIFATSVGVISQYALQALLGLFVTLLFIKTMFPDLAHAFGMLLPLGFALGPGQAFAIGKGWEAFGFHGAGSVGLTFAAIGFLWACFGGVFLINYGIRKRWIGRSHAEAFRRKGVQTGVYAADANRPVGSHLTTETEAIDSMSFNLGMVLMVYLLTYLFLKLVTFLLSFAGPLGNDLAVNLWGISFVFAALMALLVKVVLGTLRLQHIVDNGTLTRISGSSVDLLVTGAVAGISLTVVSQYWLPILVLTLLAGTLTGITVPWICSRMFRDHRFHRTLVIFGASTGTMPTGLALLRVIDPEFETPVATDYVYSSGITFVLAIPFIMIINLPIYTYSTGNPMHFWIAVAVSFAYLVFVTVSFLMLSKRRAYQNVSSVWVADRDRGKRKSA
jgi:ESS family glutamate:Na+ symporter